MNKSSIRMSDNSGGDDTSDSESARILQIKMSEQNLQRSDEKIAILKTQISILLKLNMDLKDKLNSSTCPNCKVDLTPVDAKQSHLKTKSLKLRPIQELLKLKEPVHVMPDPLSSNDNPFSSAKSVMSDPLSSNDDPPTELQLRHKELLDTSSLSTSIQPPHQIEIEVLDDDFDDDLFHSKLSTERMVFGELMKPRPKRRKRIKKYRGFGQQFVNKGQVSSNTSEAGSSSSNLPSAKPQIGFKSDQTEAYDVEVLVEVEEDQSNLNHNPQDLEGMEQSGLNNGDQPLVSIVQEILQEIGTNEDQETSKGARDAESNQDCSSKRTGNIKDLSGSNRNNEPDKQMIKFRPMKELTNPIHHQAAPTSKINKLSTLELNDKSSGMVESVIIEASSSKNMAIPNGQRKNKSGIQIAPVYSLKAPLNKDHLKIQPFRPLVQKKETLHAEREAILSKTCGLDTNSHKGKTTSVQPKMIQDEDAPLVPFSTIIASGNKRKISSEQWMRMYDQSKKKCMVEFLDQTNHWSQEVTEITPNILKVDPEADDQGNQTKIHCGICRKAFTNAGSLLVHSVRHDEYVGERNCTVCPFKGSRIVMLTHMRSKHTKEKLFHCTICIKTFHSCAIKKYHRMKKHKA